MEAILKLKQWFVDLLQRHRNIVRISAIISNLAAAVALLFWLFDKQIEALGYSFDQEPVFVLLTTIFVVLNQLYRWLLNESEYSPAFALATGYVSNFLIPSVTQLVEDGVSHPVLYVYKIENISELHQDNIDRVKASISNNNFEVKQVNLKPKNARARDVMLIQKSKAKKVYFDFPNTLTSLTSYIDYKIGSRQDESSEKRKDRIAEELIEKFYSKVEELIDKNNISENIQFCDKDLDFIF